MTPNTGAAPHEVHSSPLADLATLSGEVSRLAGLVATMRGAEGASKHELRSLTVRLEKLERESRARMDSDSRQSWQARPAPIDPENPTDGEIRIHIVNQLYQTGCWNGKHTSGVHLGRGHLARVESRRVEAAIKGLRSEGILLAHGKSPDEHFSLNPEGSSQIYRMLGIPVRGRAQTPRAPLVRDVSGASDGVQDSDVSPEYVDVGRFENSLRSLRPGLDQDGRALGRLSESLELHLRAFSEYSVRLEGCLNRLESRLEVLERQAETRRPDPTHQRASFDPRSDPVEGSER